MNPQLEKAELLIGLRRFEAARALLATVLAAEPDDADALARMAQTWYADGDYPRTLEYAEGALRSTPGFQFPWRIKALAELQLSRAATAPAERARRLEQAKAAAARAVELGPQDSENHRILSVVTRETAPAEALRVVRHALEIDPDYVELHVLHGSILRHDNSGPEADAAARQAFQEALRLDPENVEALYQLAFVDLASGDKQTAVTRLRRVAELDHTKAATVRADLEEIERPPPPVRLTQPGPYVAPRRRSSGRWRTVWVVCVLLAIVGNVVVGVTVRAPEPAEPSRQPTTYQVRNRPVTPYVVPSFPVIPTFREFPTYLPRPVAPGVPPPRITVYRVTPTAAVPR